MGIHVRLTRHRRYGSTCNPLACSGRTTIDARCRILMATRFLILLLLAGSFTAFAQTPRENDRRPEAAAPIERSQCDLLAGAEPERCIAEEKSMREEPRRSEAADRETCYG